MVKVTNKVALGPIYSRCWVSCGQCYMVSVDVVIFFREEENEYFCTCA